MKLTQGVVMKQRRWAVCPTQEEVGSSTKEVGRKRGRPVKKRFHSSDFPLKPRGEEGGDKRTPLHIGDCYAHYESYEAEEVLARCMQRGKYHYQVQLVPN